MSPPLANQLRPTTLEDFIGQEHLVGPGKFLRQLITQDQLPSIIFWGPPGTGKTTLAKIIAKRTQSQFIQLSAVLSGVKDIREAVNQAQSTPLIYKNTILFIDEIHRFNKAQQDSLLPHVETGTLTLIGATTENPSFEVISALLSRCRVLTLNQLTDDHIITILKRAIEHLKKTTSKLNDTAGGMRNVETGLPSVNSNNIPSRQHKVPAGSPIISKGDLAFLAQSAHGDARAALNTLELSLKLATPNSPNSPNKITRTHIREALQSAHLLYDRAGDEHYNTISAFIKSMRASQPNAAIYYLTRMVEAGEDPKFIARRLVIFASEDIGMANPNALLLANAVFRACETIGYPECAINLAHGVVYLATSKKDRRVYDALKQAQADIREHGNLPIPLKIRNAPTELMKNLDYGKGYEMYTEEDLLPKQIQGKNYYESRSKKYE